MISDLFIWVLEGSYTYSLISISLWYDWKPRGSWINENKSSPVLGTHSWRWVRRVNGSQSEPSIAFISTCDTAPQHLFPSAGSSLAGNYRPVPPGCRAGLLADTPLLCARGPETLFAQLRKQLSTGPGRWKWDDFQFLMSVHNNCQ